jgi:hypothetical protein
VPPFDFHDPSRRVVNSYFAMQVRFRAKVDGFVSRTQACQLENSPSTISRQQIRQRALYKSVKS